MRNSPVIPWGIFPSRREVYLLGVGELGGAGDSLLDRGRLRFERGWQIAIARSSLDRPVE